MNDRRQLGLVSATALVVATMVGSGVFSTSGLLLAELHSPWRVLAVWAAGGVIAALGALCYGALARRIPESGGEYVFLSQTLHPAAGYVAGWISLIVGFSAPLAATAFALSEYLKGWLPGVPPAATGTAAVLIFAALHAAHVERGAWVQNLAVAVELVLIALFIGVALPKVGAHAVAPAAPVPVSALGLALVWVSYSYAGWNAATYIGGEVRRPERNLPLALILGTLLVTVAYLALNVTFLFCAPRDVLAGKVEVARVAAEVIGGRTLADLVTALVVLALLTSVSSLIMAGPRVSAQMAGDGYLPHVLRSGGGPPRAAIALHTMLAMAMLWTATFDGLLTYIGFTLGLSTAGTVIGLMRLRMREGKALPVAGWPWVPVLFLLAVGGTTALGIVRRPRESLLGIATILAGVVAWVIAERQRGRASGG